MDTTQLKHDHGGIKGEVLGGGVRRKHRKLVTGRGQMLLGVRQDPEGHSVDLKAWKQVSSQSCGVLNQRFPKQRL